MEGLEKQLLMGTAWRFVIQRALVPALVRFGQLPPVADALEIGAGGGFAAETLLDWFPGWRLTVTDYDNDIVEVAKSDSTASSAGPGSSARMPSPFPMGTDRSTW
jgi:methylase of polypeptide subunit release factors